MRLTKALIWISVLATLVVVAASCDRGVKNKTGKSDSLSNSASSNRESGSTQDALVAGETADSQDSQDGEPEELLTTVISEQQESRENLRRLAEGQVVGLTVTGKTNGDTTEKEVPVDIEYSDGTTLAGTITLIGHSQSGVHYLIAKATSEESQEATDSIPVLGEEELAVGEKIIDFQHKRDYQETVHELLNGKIKSIELKNRTPGEPDENKVTIETEWTYTDGKLKAYNIIMERVNGFWYLIGLTE